jgi:L-fucose isomerase-like protein
MPAIPARLNPPRVGVLTTSTDAFDPQTKDNAEKTAREVFEDLRSTGRIAGDSLVLGRALQPHEALEAADAFASARVDLVAAVNVGFPNGQVFLTLAVHPYLSRIPLAVLAEPEPGGDEWAANAWCGAMMNNYAAVQLGRPIALIPGPFQSPHFGERLSDLLDVARTIRDLRRDYLGRFGDAPGGFHSATGDQLAFAATFGTRVDTVDLTAVMNAYHSGSATGCLGEARFSEDQVREIEHAITQNRIVRTPPEMIGRAARLYHAYLAVIRANGFTSAAFRCWPEHNEPFIDISPCLAMSLLLTRGDLTAAACEGDWPAAVVQTACTLLSGEPAVCLDWVDFTGGSPIVQLGHCGMGLGGKMAPRGADAKRPDSEAVDVHPVLRQAGKTMGPVLTGEFEFGMKTGACLTRRPNGRFALLAFRGESSETGAVGRRYSGAGLHVKHFERLNRLTFEQGFPHHMAMAFGDIHNKLRLLCTYLGVEFVSPEEG